MSGSFSTAIAQSILNAFSSISSWTVPTGLYVGLSTTDPGDTGGGVTEPSTGSYARVSIGTGGTYWQLSGRVLSNKATITFPTATANWGTVYYAVLYDASTSGNFLGSMALMTSPVPFVGEYGSTVNKIFVSGGASTFPNTTQVVVEGISLPSGLAGAVTYFVINTTSDNDEFQLSLTSGGSAVSLGSDGWGTLGLDGSQQVRTGNTLSFAASQLSITLD